MQGGEGRFDQSPITLAVAEIYLLFVPSFNHQVLDPRLRPGVRSDGLAWHAGKDTAHGRGQESGAGGDGEG